MTTVLFLFPPALPVTGSNMNYCVVAFAVVLMIATIQWFVDARKTFKGPKVVLLEGQAGSEGEEMLRPSPVESAKGGKM
jgi:choline transport protein